MLGDVYEQLALLADIEQSEQEERATSVFTILEVKDRLNKWVKQFRF